MTVTPPRLPPEALEELRRLRKAATPGPWQIHHDLDRYGRTEVIGNVDAELRDSTWDASYEQAADTDCLHPRSEANAALIVAAVNALPSLLLAAEALPRVEAEAFALAANACEDGYAGEHGHHRCRVVDRANAALAASQAEVEHLRSKLDECAGCVQAAISEGLYDRLVELDPTHGGIRDLVERRLLHVEPIALAALSDVLPSPCPHHPDCDCATAGGYDKCEAASREGEAG